MGGRPRPILLRESLPLAPRPEHVEYAIEDLSEGDWRPSSRARTLLLSEERSYLCPQIIRNAPDRGQLAYHEHRGEIDTYGLSNQTCLATQSIFGIGSKSQTNLLSRLVGGIEMSHPMSED